jgi:hypothetical protein
MSHPAHRDPFLPLGSLGLPSRMNNVYIYGSPAGVDAALTVAEALPPSRALDQRTPDQHRFKRRFDDG